LVILGHENLAFFPPFYTHFEFHVLPFKDWQNCTGKTSPEFKYNVDSLFDSVAITFNEIKFCYLIYQAKGNAPKENGFRMSVGVA
jgi:hypothetical protein